MASASAVHRIDPRLTAALTRLVNEGPNRWVPTGISGSGTTCYLRGMTGGHSGGRVQEAHEEALSWLRGAPQPGRHVTSFDASGRSEAEAQAMTEVWATFVTRGYAQPLAVRGRVDAARIQPSPFYADRRVVDTGIDDVEGIALLTPEHVDSLTWMEQHARLMVALERLGFAPEQGTRGAEFLREVSAMLGSPELRASDGKLSAEGAGRARALFARHGHEDLAGPVARYGEDAVFGYLDHGRP